jgi:VanZ family protein
MADPEGSARAGEQPLGRLFQALGRLLQRLPRALGAAGAVLWAALIWYVSSKPGIPFAPSGPLGAMLSNLAHAPEYGIFAVWMVLALPRRDGWPVLGARAATTILLIAGLYGAVDEYHQSFTPNREASALDVLTDLVGAGATLACIAVAGGPRASSRQLLFRLVLGLLACAVAAAIATFAPELLSQASSP